MVVVLLSVVEVLMNKIIFEGEIVMFYCKVIGNLVLEIIWMKNGKIVGLGEMLSFEMSRN